MIRHHPADDLLLALAAGSLDSGRALVTAVHLDGCPHCRVRLREFDALGGALLEDIEPALLRPDALARALERIDAHVGAGRSAAVAEPRVNPPAQAAPGMRAALPAGTPLPSSLQGCASTPWRWIGPGMHYSRVTLPHDAAANVFMLRIAAGKSLPRHTHSDCELTQVLYGSFHDGRARFGAGDFDETDGSIRHQPVVEASGECVCLASVNGKVLFEGTVARALGSLVGM